MQITIKYVADFHNITVALTFKSATFDKRVRVAITMLTFVGKGSKCWEGVEMTPTSEEMSEKTKHNPMNTENTNQAHGTNTRHIVRG